MSTQAPAENRPVAPVWMLCWKMYRAPIRSLLVIWTSTLPVNSRSLNSAGTLRVIGAKSMVAVLVPSETANFWILVESEIWGFPAFTAYGPIAFKAATAGLPGNAAANWVRPFGVGVRVEDVEGEPAERCRSKYGVKKNHALLRLIGPPIEPPNLFSTYLGMGPTGLHPAAGFTGAQNPNTGFFS